MKTRHVFHTMHSSAGRFFFLGSAGVWFPGFAGLACRCLIHFRTKCIWHATVTERRGSRKHALLRPNFKKALTAARDLLSWVAPLVRRRLPAHRRWQERTFPRQKHKKYNHEPTDRPTDRPTNRPTDRPTNQPTNHTVAFGAHGKQGVRAQGVRSWLNAAGLQPQRCELQKRVDREGSIKIRKVSCSAQGCMSRSRKKGGEQKRPSRARKHIVSTHLQNRS